MNDREKNLLSDLHDDFTSGALDGFDRRPRRTFDETSEQWEREFKQTERSFFKFAVVFGITTFLAFLAILGTIIWGITRVT